MAVTNNFSGGTAGTTITAANSGGASGNAFDTVTVGPAGSTHTFDAWDVEGSPLCGRYATAGTAGTIMDEWIATYGTVATGTDDFGSFCLWLSGAVGTNFTLISLRNGAAGANVSSRIQLTSAGKIQFTDGAPNVVKATSTTSIPSNQWVRVDYRFRPGATATTGQVQLWIHLNAAAAVGDHDETISSTSVDTGSAAATAIYWGINTSAVNLPLSGGFFRLAHLRARDTAQSGPPSLVGLPHLAVARTRTR